ncbi:UNVERIFIED_CONTAM: hypothetical protein GTU68_053271 [Idotea baltica]|nr:hypothetical protein [Idotea baltica]
MTEFGATGDGFSIMDKEVDTMYESYTENRAHFFVLLANEKVIGGAGIAQLAGADLSICELRKMYYLPEARGIGYGSKMMRVCIDAAKESKFKTIYLETLSSMASANVLYDKFGFTECDGQIGNTGHHKCNSFKTLSI